MIKKDIIKYCSSNLVISKQDNFKKLLEYWMNYLLGIGQEEDKVLIDLLVIFKEEININPEDILGQIYSELSMTNNKGGQVFTPFHVAELMAKITLPDLADVIKYKGIVTLSDPCCGSGVMALAAAKTIKEQGYDTKNQVWIQCMDIDLLSVWMCFIQLSCYGVNTEVIHGNIITQEVWTTYKTK